MRVQTKGIDYTNRDYESFREMMLNHLKVKMPEYTDLSGTDAGVVILESLANGLDILSFYLDTMANDLLLPYTQSRKMASILSSYLGYTPFNQTASEYPQVFVLSQPRDEETLIPRGTVVSTAQTSDTVSIPFETTQDLIIPSGKLGNEKHNGNYLYTVPVSHGTTISMDNLGTSRNVPNQVFTLNYPNVLVDTIQLYVNEGDGFELWKKVDKFLDSNENSKVYSVYVDEFDICYIQFGNGIRGKIPAVYDNGIVADYRVGGGESGNVNVNMITELESSVPYVDSTFNLTATKLGIDKESLESIKRNAPANYRTRDRLVTLQDYSDLLRINFRDFLEVHTTRDITDKRLVHIYYMLRQGFSLSPSLQEKVGKYIAGRAMIGTNYDLNSFTPQPVNMNATLIIESGYDKEVIKKEIKKYLEDVVFSYGELTFKDTINKSELEMDIIKTIKGVKSFRITNNDDIISPSEEKNILTFGSLSIA